MVSFGTLFWLFFANVAYFLYLVPDLVPDFFSDLCLLSLGLWYHFIIPLIGFTLLKGIVGMVNVSFALLNNVMTTNFIQPYLSPGARY